MAEKKTIGNATLYFADCRDALQDIEAETIDSCVVDPPYGLSFMGKGWDHEVPDPEIWRLVSATLKPGAHLLSFFGSRTYHRGTCAIEDAGFSIRDQIMWVYGSGFPKSLDVSKALDKAAGVEREIVGFDAAKAARQTPNHGAIAFSGAGSPGDITAPATPEAQQWEGWGTALKPAHEPITVARKPFRGTVAANVLEHGCGGLNIDACRVAGVPRTTHADGNRVTSVAASGHLSGKRPHGSTSAPAGRFPANFIHDGSDEVMALFPAVGRSSTGNVRGCDDLRVNDSATPGHKAGEWKAGFGDSGTAARFFYCPKASKRDRGEGNGHPTVKPTALMSYLVKLVTQPGGVVLDPFMGSGSTLVAALRGGFRCIGIERDRESFETACRRVEAFTN